MGSDCQCIQGFCSGGIIKKKKKKCFKIDWDEKKIDWDDDCTTR